MSFPPWHQSFAPKPLSLWDQNRGGRGTFNMFFLQWEGGDGLLYASKQLTQQLYSVIFIIDILFSSTECEPNWFDSMAFLFQFWEAVELLSKWWKVATLLNFLLFLVQGRYQFLLERALGIRAVFRRPQGVRQVRNDSFLYMSSSSSSSSPSASAGLCSLLLEEPLSSCLFGINYRAFVILATHGTAVGEGVFF